MTLKGQGAQWESSRRQQLVLRFTSRTSSQGEPDDGGHQAIITREHVLHLGHDVAGGSRRVVRWVLDVEKIVARFRSVTLSAGIFPPFDPGPA
jgi:hypothetical protein